MKQIIIIFLFITISFVALSQQNKSLLVCEKLNNDTSFIIAYRFDDSNLLKKDTVFRDTNRAFYFGGYIYNIYKNKYIVDFRGIYYNLEKDSLFVNEKRTSELVKCFWGDSIILYQDGGNKDGVEYYFIDLNTNIFDTLIDPVRFSVEGKLSPDKTMGLRYNWPTNEITLTRITGDTILGNCFARQNRKYSIDIRGVPLFWVDNEHFLTQTSNGVIVEVDLQGNIKPVLTIKKVRKSSDAIKIYRDANGKIIYHYSKGAFGTKERAYWLDIENKTYQKYNPQSVYSKYGFIVKKRYRYSLFKRNKFKKSVMTIKNQNTGKRYKIKSKNRLLLLGWVTSE